MTDLPSAEPFGAARDARASAHAVSSLMRGEPIVVGNAACPSAGGHLVAAASRVDAPRLSRMRAVAGGLMCVALPQARLLDLGIPRASEPARSHLHVGVDLAGGDRPCQPPPASHIAAIVRALGDPRTTREDLRTPGWVLPVGCDPDAPDPALHAFQAAVAVSGCDGATAAVLAVQIVGDDGEVIGSERLPEFASRIGVPLLRSDDALEHAAGVEIGSAVELPLAAGPFRAIGFCCAGDPREHLVVALGDVGSRSDLPVYVHRECFSGDVLRSVRCDCRANLDAAVRMIVGEGAGAIVYLRSSPEERMLSFAACLDVQHAGTEPATSDALRVLRELGVASTRLMRFPDVSAAAA